MLGLTQKELAELAGVSQSLIAKIENGLINPSYDIVTQIFRSLQRLENRVDKKAKDIMSSPFIYISPEEPLIKATQLMEEHAFSQLPVIDESNLCIGSISDQTVLGLVSRSIEGELDFEQISSRKVREVMGEPFPVVSALTPLQAISNLLSYTPAVLVNQKGKIKGIITRSDLFKVLQ